jgi:hypothetical protein
MIQDHRNSSSKAIPISLENPKDLHKTPCSSPELQSNPNFKLNPTTAPTSYILALDFSQNSVPVLVLSRIQSSPAILQFHPYTSSKLHL